jgi:hypothetical protein
MFEELSEDDKYKVAQAAILITELIVKKGKKTSKSEK